ncbi:MAG: hypothetical protein HZC28_13830 [Spirochaetes bacterium]|nr:hypothetical protein [Spirochaetota bacterium]
MLTSAKVKKMARALGADLCGIASMERFEGAPKQQDPRYIFPDAKACITLAFRIPRGYLRGIEEGTYFNAYTAMGYGGLNAIYMPVVMREICCFIEDNGFEAAPVPNFYSGSSISFATQQYDPTRSRAVSPDKPSPDVLVDFRVAAFASGLGEFGWSKMFLTPEFGPMQRIVCILTDAPLAPDPIFTGKVCDRCKICVAQCTGCAISKDETESITVAGHKVEWGKFDYIKCSVAYVGGLPEYNPFLQIGADPEKYKDQYSGGAMLDKHMPYPVPFSRPAVEGARGCMRACYAHLEEKGLLKKHFVNRFRKRAPWKLAGEAAALPSDPFNVGKE